MVRRPHPAAPLRVAIATLLIALLLTAAATAIAGRAVTARGGDVFRLAADKLRSRLATRLDAYESVLRATRGFLAASDDVTPEEFAIFVASLRLAERLPGIQGIGWSARVPAAGRDAFITAVRARGRPFFRLWPEGEREEYHAILLLEPGDRRNLVAVGYDMHTEPVRAEAMDRARDTGDAAASGPVVLVQEIDAAKQAGFLIYLPVYARGLPQRDAAERRAALVGFAYAPFRSADLMRALVADEPLDLRFAVRDQATGTELFATDPGIGAGRTTRELTVAGRAWTIAFAPTAAVPGQELVWAIAVGGVVAGLLLAGGSFLLARARQIAEQVAADLRVSEAALRDREARLRFLSEASAALASSLEHEASLGALARLSVPTVADWCAVWLADEGLPMRRLIVVHADERMVALTEELRRRWPEPTDEWPRRVVAEGRPLLIPAVADVDLRAVAVDEEHLRLLRGLGVRSLLLVPLQARGRILGALGFAMSGADRRFAPDDIGFMEELARRAAVAIDNARLFEGERATRTRLAEQAEELTRSNAELEQFAYIASHDLQEPLRMVSSYLDLLDRRIGGRLDARERGWLNFAVDGARRMQGLIKDLLAYSRAGRGGERDPAPTDARRALDEALENLRNAIAESGARITAGPLPVLRVDRPQLVQVLQNLVANAIKFRGSAPPVIHVDAAPAGEGRWTIAVRDNGIGVEPEFRQRIFEIFQRLHTREDYPGTGIGLAICKRIVERHGGAIWIDPAPDGGSVFRFTLPGMMPPGDER